MCERGLVVPYVWLNVEYVWWSVCVGTCVIGVSVYCGPCDGLFSGRCVNGVICVCGCRYRKWWRLGNIGGNVCRRGVLVCVGMSSSLDGGMR